MTTHVILLYTLYIFGVHLKTMLCSKPGDNKQCYKEVGVQTKVDPEQHAP